MLIKHRQNSLARKRLQPNYHSVSPLNRRIISSFPFYQYHILLLIFSIVFLQIFESFINEGGVVNGLPVKISSQPLMEQKSEKIIQQFELQENSLPDFDSNRVRKIFWDKILVEPEEIESALPSIETQTTFSNENQNIPLKGSFSIDDDDDDDDQFVALPKLSNSFEDQSVAIPKLSNSFENEFFAIPELSNSFENKGFDSSEQALDSISFENKNFTFDTEPSLQLNKDQDNSFLTDLTLDNSENIDFKDTNFPDISNSTSEEINIPLLSSSQSNTNSKPGTKFPVPSGPDTFLELARDESLGKTKLNVNNQLIQISTRLGPFAKAGFCLPEGDCNDRKKFKAKVNFYIQNVNSRNSDSPNAQLSTSSIREILVIFGASDHKTEQDWQKRQNFLVHYPSIELVTQRESNKYNAHVDGEFLSDWERNKEGLIENILCSLNQVNGFKGSKFNLRFIGAGVAGVYALFAALEVKFKNPGLNPLVLQYGSPRMGDRGFGNLVAELLPGRVARFTNGNDWMPQYPPLKEGYIGILPEIFLSGTGVFVCNGIQNDEGDYRENPACNQGSQRSFWGLGQSDDHLSAIFGVEMNNCNPTIRLNIP